MNTALQSEIQMPDGFRLVRSAEAPGLRGLVRQIEHVLSGARILHVHADDPENLFSISFPTPPPDATGLPHILEHSVLAGSRRFPVREPFFEMLKMSMATFINAMTGQDCTYYPVSSTVKQDLFNLADVYFDAVFHPLLTEDVFRREGHHLAPASPDNPLGPLAVSGIVYNEMKGAYSSPEARLYFTWVKALLPDTIYARNSAGDPAAIPGLSYAEFKRFYDTHYQPSNAYFIFYGDIPTGDYLAFLGPRLDDYQRQHDSHFRPAASGRDGSVPRQPHWPAPRVCRATYPASPGESLEDKTYLTLHWLAGDALDPEDAVLRHILSLVLLGNEAAPLKKAVIDSRLGHDLVHSGMMDIGQEALLAIGLSGSNPDKAEEFERMVLSTLDRLAGEPIRANLVESAFRQATYEYLEIAPMFPLHVMERLLGPWRFGADPLLFSDMEPHLDAVRRRYEADPLLFNRCIRERLLDNPHRLLTVLQPDRDGDAAAAAELAGRLQTIRNGLSDAEAATLAEQAAELQRQAGTPNPPEAVALLPQLRLGDLPPKPRHVPTTVSRINGGPIVLRNDVFTKKVNYLSFNFDLRGLPGDLWLYLPRYCDAIVKCGAAGLDYEEIARRTAAFTGGIDSFCVFHRHAGNPAQPVWGLRVVCKALDEQMSGALELLGNLLFAVDPRDRQRFLDVISQARAGYREAVLNGGQNFARWRAAGGFNEDAFLEETVHGLPQLPLVAAMGSGDAGGLENAMTRIERIRDFLLSGDRLTVSFTGADRAFDSLVSALRQWVGRMKNAAPTEHRTGFSAAARPACEGLAAPIQVAHCVRAMPAPAFDHPDSVALAVGARLMTFDYLLPEIRLKGNAYGAGFSYSPSTGLLWLSSFRDPHVARTLGVFDKVREFAKDAEWTQTDVSRSIIGVAKEAERPPRPAEATAEALSRHVTGLTPELRERRYAGLLGVAAAAVKRSLLDALETGAGRAATCVMASRTMLEKANRADGAAPMPITDVPV